MRSAEPDASHHLTSQVIVRVYEPRDQAALRQIACETADRGEPIGRVFPDHELIADLLTRYYTDYDPTAVWVAEEGGRLIGYLTGCLDSHRYWRTMRWRVIPRALIRAIGHGTAWSGRTWGFVQRGLLNWWRAACRRHISLAEYPAHLHVNLRAGFRGQRVGERLLQRFCDQACAARVRGIHVVVRKDNAMAQRLFERAGFTPLICNVSSHHEVSADQDTMIYAKRL